MSATILAADFAAKVKEHQQDSITNLETYFRNRLIEVQIEVAKQTVADITEEIKP